MAVDIVFSQVMPPPEIPQESSKIPWLPRLYLRYPSLDFATLVVGTILAFHIAIELLGGISFAADLYIQMGLTWSGLKEWKVWQLFSYVLLHGNWLHLIVNVILLWLLGGRVIHILGHRAWLKVCMLSVLLGGLFHIVTSMVVTANGFTESRLVGVSPACYAMLLVLTTVSPDSKMWPLPVSGKNLGLGLIVTELLLWLMKPEMQIPLLSQFGRQLIDAGMGGVFQVSHACHFGGALVGWWVASRLLAPAPSLEDLQQMRAKRERDIGIDSAG